MGAMSEFQALIDAGDWSDPLWRLNNLYTIRDKEMREVPFVMNAQQTQLFDNLWWWNDILKARQLGFSTVLLIAALDQAIFSRNFKSMLIADTQDNAFRIFEEKVLWVFDHLPEAIRSTVTVTARSKSELAFSNGSSLLAGTSARGGTYNWVHVSELGKIAAKYPAKAKEIITSVEPAVHANGYWFIESTAEGQAGKFYELTMEALKAKREKRSLTRKEFRLHFFPWHEEKTYRLSNEETKLVVVADNDKKYFDDLRLKNGITLDANQKAWWVTTRKILGNEMKREHPAFIEEAFEQAIEGAIYELQMRQVREAGMICDLPHDPSLPVNTFWDLGVSDYTSIWFHQKIGQRHCFIRYYENNNQGLSHYWDYCQSLGYTWGKHYLPHDADKKVLGEQVKTVRAMLEGLGMKNAETVSRIPKLRVGIDSVRNRLPMAAFDQTNCARGISCLDMYQWEWNAKDGRWNDHPWHNEFSHGADAIRTWAEGFDFGGDLRKPRGISRPANWRTV